MIGCGKRVKRESGAGGTCGAGAGAGGVGDVANVAVGRAVHVGQVQEQSGGRGHVERWETHRVLSVSLRVRSNTAGGKPAEQRGQSVTH